MDDEVRLSKGQKKKLKQRRKNAEESVAKSSCAEQAEGEGSPARCDSSEDTPSEFSSSESASETKAFECDEAKKTQKATGPPGWPSPKSMRPPSWPPEGAELLSEHRYADLPPLRKRMLRLAAMPCPQPKDKLQWRILPLVRNALGLAEEELSAAEVLRFVRGNLPSECLVTISTSRLSELVNLVMSRNVRRGRLKQVGKRYGLPPVEDQCVLLPQVCGSSPTSVWVAWCTETKLPREVAMRFDVSRAEFKHGIDEQLQQLQGQMQLAKPGESIWLFSRLLWHPTQGHEAARVPAGAEEVAVDGSKVWLMPKEDSGHSSVLLWKDAKRHTLWSLSTPPAVSLDTALELAQQCLQQPGL
eukprot:TRINITY_DN42813_c0_g1_i1.p1 TRINITY_DN42813_c0_g1~~TRINITY_DN42813_c0_g1_i1.p1  ORF type:complete len:369 (-),score=86.54 TRINITY_DN42813_c0_g1_i1:8-1081(-)